MPFFHGSPCIHTYACTHLCHSSQTPSVHKHACINQCSPTLHASHASFPLHSHSSIHQCHPSHSSMHLHTLLPGPPYSSCCTVPVPQLACDLYQFHLNTTVAKKFYLKSHRRPLPPHAVLQPTCPIHSPNHVSPSHDLSESFWSSPDLLRMGVLFGGR